MADALSRPSLVPLGQAYSGHNPTDVPLPSKFEPAIASAAKLQNVDYSCRAPAAPLNPYASSFSPLMPVEAVTRAQATDVVALQIVDHHQLSIEQKQCPDVANHRAGKHHPELTFKDVELTPKTWVYCEMSTGNKARPLVPKPHRLL